MAQSNPANVTVSYAGSNLVEISEDGIKTLKTAGKYLTDDIVITYVGGRKYTLTTIVPEQTFTAAMTSLGGYQSELTNNDAFENGASYLITYDGDTYVGECGLIFSSDYMVGTPSAFWSTSSDTALVPFGVDWDTTVMSVAVFDTNQHTIKVERLEFVDGIEPISGESYAVEIYLENPLHASEAQDPACIIYESDKRDGERTQIGQIASPTGSTVVNMSKRILTVKFFSDGALSVQQGDCWYDVHPISSLDDDEVCFYVEGDGQVRIDGVDYDD